MTSTTDPNMVRTTAGERAFQEYNLRLEGHTWKIQHAGAILSREDEQRFLGGDSPRVPYGIVLWPGAIALAHEIASRPLTGLRILEIGAGTGLPGIVAATRGARVVQTDRQEFALSVCQKNAERNGVTTIEHRVADWTLWDDTAQYDYILGADVLYATAMHEHLRPIFDTNLAPGGTVLLSDPFRTESFALLEAMQADGWRVSMNKWTVGMTSPGRAVGVYALTR